MASDTITDVESVPATMDMEIEKREREDEDVAINGGVTKKQKVDDEKSVEENRMENLVEEKSDPVSLGPKTFLTSVEMFDYFYKLLHHWPVNFTLNKYEYMVVLDLIKKGHPEPEKKIGSGVKAFEIRFHPQYNSRCFFISREDQSVEDFSFRKCVDHILPLPENLKIKPDENKSSGGGKRGGGGGGRGGGRGRGWGRGGRSRR